MDSLLHPFLFLLALPLVLFVPGWAFVAFLERKGDIFTALERAVLAVAMSLVSVDAIFLILDRLHVPLRAATVLPVVVIFSLIFFFLGKKKISQEKTGPTKAVPIAFLVILAAIVAIKTVYFLPSVIPNSTDLGHHMYWVKELVTEQSIPEYAEREIIQEDGKYVIGEPEPISDFIVGEHLVLSAIQMLSGMGFDSVYPSLTLFLIHLFTAIALYVLALRLFAGTKYQEKIALTALLLIGLLYSFSPPEMKYILGGVVGNTFGNLLIPAIFLLLVIALRLRRPDLLATAVFLMFGLAYTHHLSTLLFAIVLVSVAFFLILFNRRFVRDNVLPLVFSRNVLVTFASCLVFFFLVWTPSYIRNSAVNTVIGAPTASEHLGFSFSQLKFAVGEPRMMFGLLGIILLLASKKLRTSETAALLLGWTLPLILLVMEPDLTRIDLPSGRVANYAIFPLVLLASFALVWVLEKMKEQSFLPVFLRNGIFFLLFLLIMHNGFFDNGFYQRGKNEGARKMLSLRDASQYLGETLPPEAVALHDHINILGDSWIKLSFMRDYNFPFYRANLFRYERITDKQEKCTLYMISQPNSTEAAKCFQDLDVRAVLVNESIDGPQFRHFRNFSLTYNGPYYSTYWHAPLKK